MQPPIFDPPPDIRLIAADMDGEQPLSGIDGRTGNAAFARLGMDDSLRRLSPFLATLLAQLRDQYGLDLDASLRGLDVRLLEQTGDSARLRLRLRTGQRERQCAGQQGAGPCRHHFKLMVVFTPCEVVLSSNQRAVTVLVCV